MPDSDLAPPLGKYSETSPYENVELARNIVSILRDNNIHPVLIFGTQVSGKTTIIQSLINYIKSSDDAVLNIRLGDVVWPRKHSAHDSVKMIGSYIYDNAVSDFYKGKKTERTNREMPFFVPINAIKDGETKKFAFLEGMGEWFERDKVETAVDDREPEEKRTSAPFRPMRQIIKLILEEYEHGISMIFVAPAVDGSLGEPKEYAHECLANVMSEVDSIRAHKDRDNLLFLVSKWDALHSPGDPTSIFSNATAADVLEIVANWKYVWPKFVSIGGFQKGAKALMPYSGGWIQRDGSVLSSPRYKKDFDRFNRVLWNWIYQNASVAFSDVDRSQGEILYEDVVPPNFQEMGIYNSLVKAVTARRLYSRRKV